MPADILIYALVAAGLIFWLRNILGTRHGDERERPNPFTRQAEEQRTASAKQAQTAPADSANSPQAAFTAGLSAGMDNEPALDRHMEILPAARAGLSDIDHADRHFSPLEFLRGAQEAFIMIVEAFASGDRETLKNLVEENVYQAFDQEISRRAKEDLKSQVEIHAVRRIEIIEARLERKTAYITVRFVADETNVLKGRDGNVLEGNPERITETIDVWTFMRDTKSREPGWFLAETRDDDAAQRDHKTVPDTR